MKYVFVISSILGCLFLAGCGTTTVQPNTKACTEEAKICPDGSAVARTGANCEFAPCPTTGTQWICNQDGKLCADGSTVGRAGPKCDFAPCPTASTGETVSCGITPSASCGTGK